MIDPPDLLIFDCDGVLVDSEIIANGVMAECLNEAGSRSRATTENASSRTMKFGGFGRRAPTWDTRMGRLRGCSC